jgi:lipoate-protein ligase A
MLLIDNQNSTDPTINLALEEYCYRNLDSRHDYVLFYINQPSIIIGNHQNPFQEVNFDFAIQNKIRPVRRISGGGTVYHDPGNLNFSFITAFTGEMLDYFKTLLQPVLSTLQRLGVPAQLTEKNNIIVDGKKISGNSQHTNMRRMLSHGTLLFDAGLDILQQVLQSKQQIIQSRAVASIPSSVTNISGYLSRPMEMEAFTAELIGGISNSFGELEEYQLTTDDWDAVYRLSEEKYRSWEWNIGRSPEFIVTHKVQLDSMDINALITVKRGIIKDIQFSQNSLNHQTISQVQNRFIGKRYGSGEIDQLL